MRVELAAAALAVALVLPAAATRRAGDGLRTVAVPVANVWAAPGTATIPNDWRVWPTPQVTYEQRRALVGHMPTQVLYGEQRGRARAPRRVVEDRRARPAVAARHARLPRLDPRLAAPPGGHGRRTWSR